MNEPMSQEDFELACAECEGVKVSTIKAWRKSTGGYSNEKIDDMYLGYSLATAALEKQKSITRRVSAESNRLFDEKAVLIKQLEAAEREREELRAEAEKYAELSGRNAARAQKAEAEIARRDAAAGDPVYQVGTDGQWYDCKEYIYQEAKERRGACRILYTAAQPALLPPALSTEGLDPESRDIDEVRNLAHLQGANWMRERYLALGFQPEKVVMLPQPEKDGGTDWQGDITAGCMNRMRDKCIAAIDAAGVKWEVKP